MSRDETDGIWAIIPFKTLKASKWRLHETLGERRETFAKVLFRRTLAVAGGCRAIGRVVVVTADPLIAGEARRAGAIVLDDPERSLNAACTRALALAADAGARRAMIIHADLARLTPAALADIIDRDAATVAATGDAITLIPCKQGTGTNILLCSPRSGFAPVFGEGSLAAHRRAAGSRARILESAAAAFDVDTAEDFVALAEALGVAEGDLPAGVEAHLALDALAFGASAVAEGDAVLTAPSASLLARAAALRDAGHGQHVTYSRKVFLPLTQLCRDTCHYCTFAQPPRRLAAPFMDVEDAVAVAARGAAIGCKEALFTLGERPELRYRVAREWLAARGFTSTLDYLGHVARAVLERTGLLPHINAGCMSAAEMAALRPVSASMGLMLESAAERLCAKGGPHYGSPDKHPEARLATIEEAGRQHIPFTTGLLIGIGETRAERVEALLAIRALHRRFGHIQEIIVQNFVPKPGTRMAEAPAAGAEDLIWTIAMARILFGAEMSIQAPPNLAPAPLATIIAAGINDWGGVSPLTPDFVNPEAPWPEIERLRLQTEAAGKTLVERLTIYPAYARADQRWLDPAMRRPVRELADAGGLGRESGWRAGRTAELPPDFVRLHRDLPGRTAITRLLGEIVDHGSDHLGITDIARLFDARGADFHRLCEAADALREAANGNAATYVINRNINYTNICSYRCHFCAFSKGTRKHEGAEKPYLLDMDAISARVAEARAKGASEVCLQGGIHPQFTGETYIDIVRAVKRADPAMHVHAFSPLEVSHGATTLGMAVDAYLALLRDEGLGSLPGTAAEILHDPVRDIICPDKLNTGQWLEVIEAAHSVGLRTTATIMFGHVDDYRDWAIHLRALRDLQKRTGGFTEFVPLPFVAHEAPLYKRGEARPGPTLREAVLMHAVGRLVLFPHFENVQASWVKMGRAGMREALRAGANDLGGTLMNESITRAAGATHGQEFTADAMRAMAASLNRIPLRRTTLYGRADAAPPRQASALVH